MFLLHESCSQLVNKITRVQKVGNTSCQTSQGLKIEHYKTKFYQENPSTGSLWKNANDFLNTSKSSFSNTPQMIVRNGQTFTKPIDIANAINDAFLKKVTPKTYYRSSLTEEMLKFLYSSFRRYP